MVDDSCFPTYFQILKDRGYETVDEVSAIIDNMMTYIPPYNTSFDLEEKINWVEFCRALKEQDFTPGDEFSLNGIQFEVKGV